MDAASRGRLALIESLGDTLDDLRFNADETALYWRCLPYKTLGIVGEHTSGFKKSKERITILVICNESGTYVSHYVIGKSMKPSCFRGRVS